MACVLHVLTPAARQGEQELVRVGWASPGDVVADFRRFPPLLYEVQENRTLADVTDQWLQVPDYWSVARQWLIDFTRAGGLQEALSVDGHGFWWTLSVANITPVISDLGNAFGWVDFLQAVAARKEPESVVLYGPHAALSELALQAFPAARQEVCEGITRPLVPRSWNWSKLALLSVRLMMGLVYLAYVALRRARVCFLSSPTLLRVQPVDGKEKLTDVYLGPVMEALWARRWPVAVVEDYAQRYITWSGLRARGFCFPADLVFLLSDPRLFGRRFRRPLARKWLRRWAEFEPRLVPLACYNGMDLSALVIPVIRKEFLATAPRLESLVSLWKGILRLWRPHLLYINFSYGMLGVPVIIAARSLGITTIEQQHGIIHRNHMAYLVPRQLASDVRPPLCDRMVVWGDYTRRLLISSENYASDQVAVCGFPRMDLLAHGLPSREETLSRLGIPLDAQVVLYASNLIVGDLYPVLLDSLLGLADAPIYWIIKLHPREKRRALWEQAIRERGLQGRVQVIEDQVSFYTLLVACDLHVSYTSTTMIESAVLGKPNLGLDLPHVADPTGYAEAGAFAPVTPDQLGPVACSVLQDPARRAELLRQQKDFADDWCRHDGKAVECIMSLIDDCLAEKRRGTR